MDNLTKVMQPSGVLTGIFQLSFPISLYLGYASSAGVGWWALAFFSYAIVYIMIGHNIALHRYFAHNQFSVSKPVEYLFLWVGSMIGVGGPLSYGITHITHHTYPDTELDPHGPIRGWKSILIYFQKPVDLTETKLFNRRVVELNKKYNLHHRFYLLFLLCNAAILFLVDYKIFLFMWWIPASLACWSIGFTAWAQHKNFQANNSKIYKWVPIYEGLHKNHHEYPSRSNTAILPNEIDYTYYFCKIFFTKYKIIKGNKDV